MNTTLRTYPFEVIKLVCECGECSRCKSRERMRLQRERDPEHVRALDRARYRRDKAKRRAAMDAYHAANRERVNGIKRQYIERNPEKRKAHLVVASALRSGRLVKQPCEECGSTVRVHGHHDDYSKPLEVRWLCPQHHAELHLEGETMGKRNVIVCDICGEDTDAGLEGVVRSGRQEIRFDICEADKQKLFGDLPVQPRRGRPEVRKRRRTVAA